MPNKNLEEINWNIIKRNDKNSKKHIFNVMEKLYSEKDFQKADSYIKNSLEENLYFKNYLSFLMSSFRFKDFLSNYGSLYEKTLEKAIQEIGEENAKKTLFSLKPKKVQKENQTKSKKENNYQINISKYSRTRNINPRI